MADFELSKYQKNILDYFKKHPHDNMMIEASAGSGKTHTALLLLEDTKTSDIYVAFNNAIASEFKEKIKNKKVKVSTIHALAYSFMLFNIAEDYESKKISYQKPVLDNLKIYKLIDEQISLNYKYITFNQKMFLRENIFNAYNLARLTMTDCDNENGIDDIVHKHYLFWDFSDDKDENMKVIPKTKTLCSILSSIDIESLRLFTEEGIIDFSDMLYITYLKIKNGLWKVPYWGYYHNVVADEHQDQNLLQIAFLKLIKDKTGRYVFILDRKQAIYFFSGSDAHMADRTKKIFSPIKEFPLPICYRCAKSHIDYVNKLFPEINIEARPDAPQGEIINIDKEDIIDYIQPGDMIISRKNKWLGDVINDMISNGIKIFTEDKDLIAALKKLIKPQKYPTVIAQKNQLKKEIINYQKQLSKKRSEYSKAKKEGNEKKEESLSEQLEVVTTLNNKIDNVYLLERICGSFIKKYSGNVSTKKLIEYIDEILSTVPSKDAVRITSVHKAKGLEAENVFVLNEGRVCQGAGAEQAQQEKNLSYISLTRAKNKMYLVAEPDNEEAGGN